MKVTVNRLSLIETLTKVAKGVATRTTLPITACVLLDAREGELVMASTDLETSLCGAVKAKIGRVGATVTEPKRLLSFLKLVTEATVVLALEGGFLKVAAGKASATFEAHKREDYPKLPARINKAQAVIKDFSEALGRVAYAVASDECRPVLCSVNIKGNSLAAADGFRLAITKVQAAGELPTANITSGAVKLIRALMTGKVAVASSSNVLQFEGDGILLQTRPVAGVFPQYEQLIPQGGDIIRFDRDEMRSSLRLTKLVTDAPATRFQNKGRKLTVSAIDGSGNKTEAIIPCKGKVKIAFNPNYIDEMLSRMPAGMVVGKTEAPNKPGLFKAQGTTHVIMPMFVLWDEKKPEPAVSPAAAEDKCEMVRERGES